MAACGELGAEPVEYGAGLAERVCAVAAEGVDTVADFASNGLEGTLALLKHGGQNARPRLRQDRADAFRTLAATFWITGLRTGKLQADRSSAQIHDQ